MSEVSTRVWLDERVWNEVMSRAVTEGTTIRELIPQLVNQSLTAVPAAAQTVSVAAPPAPASAATETAAGTSDLPVVPLADVYRCGVCGGEVRLGGVSQHLNKHKKERETAEAERDALRRS